LILICQKKLSSNLLLGNWDNGKQSGFGTKTWTEGDVYEGILIARSSTKILKNIRHFDLAFKKFCQNQFTSSAPVQS
jgi:hypothetical protein